jgi:hypothetical protein
LREAQRKQGRTPSAASLELAGWLILLTNVTAEKLPATAVSYLYRVRWQIVCKGSDYGKKALRE